MTSTANPVPHWPGRMVDLGDGERVYLAQTPRSVPGKDLVLCLHGMSGAATNWTDLMAELEPDFDCAAVDLPGSGLSPPPAKRSGYSVRALAATVRRLIETLDAGAVHLVGNSMGGAVATRVAAQRNDLVKTLTLVSPALPDYRLNRSTAHFPVVSLPGIGPWLVRRYVRRYPAENRVAGVFQMCYYDSSTVHPERFALEVEALRRRDSLSYDITSLVAAARTLTLETLTPHPYSLWDAAHQVRVPALVIFGSHDRLVSPRLAVSAARYFPDARVVVLPNSGHIAQMEHPDVVAALFREMVKTAQSRATGTGNAGHRDPVDA